MKRLFAFIRTKFLNYIDNENRKASIERHALGCHAILSGGVKPEKDDKS
jgi:hypothetical protein